MNIEVDRTTLMMVEALVTEMGKEPPTPDPDYHPIEMIGEIARKHSEWDRRCASWRLLVGVRLVQAALDAHAKQAKIAATPVLRDGG